MHKRHDLAVNEPSERVAAGVVAAVMAGDVLPYDGAFELYRLVHGGRRWVRDPWARDADGRLRDVPADVWQRDVRRPLLTHLTRWWERREDLREQVESEIRAFAQTWSEGGEDAITAHWSRWRAWVEEDETPFPGAGTNECPEPRLLLTDDVDLRAVSDISAMRLDLHYARLSSLSGIERFSALAH